MNTLSVWELAYCAAVIFLAYGLRGSTGFGAVIGMPLLAMVLPLKVLVPVWTLLGFASSAAILGRERRFVAVDAFIAFIPWCLLGIALGLYVFTSFDSRMLAHGLGVLIILYAFVAMWNAMRPPERALKLPPGTAAVSGTVSGMVGAIFGTMGSMFFVIFLDTRKLPKAQFRATMSAMLMLLSTVRGAGYYAVGEFTTESWLMFAAAFPAMLAGIYAGDRIQLRLNEVTFRRVACATLLLCGLTLLWK
ncbi:MAG: permease [Betaproteobacteria bacterium]|nr:permease [Betaproteobacteria bacterium]